MGKAGDELSIRGGLVAGDKAVTVKSITKIDGPTRVYNLEVASLDGQITHNYFVGEDEILTHNIQLSKGARVALDILIRIGTLFDGTPFDGTPFDNAGLPENNPPKVQRPGLCDAPNSKGKNRSVWPFSSTGTTSVSGTFGNRRF